MALDQTAPRSSLISARSHIVCKIGLLRTLVDEVLTDGKRVIFLF